MRFQWDKSNTAHIALHGITPEEVEEVVKNDPLDVGVVVRNNEARTLHLGETDFGLVLMVVTDRAGTYRVVTARPANRKERAFYAARKVAPHGSETGNP